jgi:hypothetical protein
VPLPTDLRLALAPADTYRELLTEPVESSWLRALERPLMVAVIIGMAVTMCSAERVPLGLMLMGALCWSFVPAVQLLVGAILIALAPRRTMPMARAVELLFVAQLPWSLWVLTMTGAYRFLSASPGLLVQMLSLIIPAVWTAKIIWAFCRTVLGCSTVRALALILVHQTLTWVIFFTYVIFTSGFLVRVLAVIGR